MSAPTDASVLLPAEGLQLHALQRNPGGGTPVLFLHGWLDHAHGFDWVRDALPAAWRTVALDFRGYGQSGWAPAGSSYQLADYLLDVELTLDGLGLPAVHLVGHSMGGAVALFYAAARQARVLSLTVIENLGPFGGDPGVLTERLRGFLDDARKPARKRVYPTLEAAAARVRENNSSYGEAAALHMTRHGVRAVEGGFEFTFDPVHRRRGPIAFDEAQVLALFGEIRCPVQVIHGSNGYSFADEQMQRRLAVLRGPPVRVFDGGHHVHLDRPREVAQEIQRFIEASGS